MVCTWCRLSYHNNGSCQQALGLKYNAEPDNYGMNVVSVLPLVICRMRLERRLETRLVVFKLFIKWLRKETNKIIVAGNNEYKQTDNINFVQSSLKSHPLLVTLYISKIFQSVFLIIIFNRSCRLQSHQLKITNFRWYNKNISFSFDQMQV